VAYISYVLLVCPHSPCWPTRMHCSSALILLVGQHLIPVACRPLFSTLASCSYASLVSTHPPHRPTAPMHHSFDLVFADLHSDIWQKHRVRYQWPTSRTCCSFVLIRRTGLLLRVARLPSFSTLAYCSYAFLVCPPFCLLTFGRVAETLC